MKYNKIIEVSEDNERIYFSFFIDNNNKRIFGIPKKNCINNNIYAGINFSSMEIVDNFKAKILITELMKRTILTHPAAQLCNQDSLKLIEF